MYQNKVYRSRPVGFAVSKRLTWTILYCLILFVCFFATSSSSFLNPAKIVCKNRDKKHAIKPSKCKPAFGMKRAACEKLIRKCKCQHNIEMKWTGKGCPGTRGQGGCQCADYCGWTCPGKCRADPLKRCEFSGGQCLDPLTGTPGTVGQCPSCFPGESVVVTPTGPKRMSELKIGDYVQDIALRDNGDVKAGAVTFSQVIAFLHLQREEFGLYRELYVANALPDVDGKNETMLRLSDVHLLFVQDPLTLQYQDILASQVQIGQVVYLAGKGTTRSVLGRVTKIRDNIKAEGIYAPLTMSGTLVVDGVHVSSYTHVRHELIDAVCTPLKLYAKYIGPIPEWYTAKGVHFYTGSLQWLEPFLPQFLIPGGSQ